MAYKPIICVDFDGTIHSYISGWKGPRTIPDPPVPGAIAWLLELLADDRIKVCILSSRSHYWLGRYAMREWLVRQISDHFWNRFEQGRLSGRWMDMIAADFWSAAEQDEEYRLTARRIVRLIKFPRHKPPAHITIDDRAMMFAGVFPTVEQMLAFRPWRVSPSDLDVVESSAQAL